jgi:DNA-binding HxlR family transcriptional regulator
LCLCGIAKKCDLRLKECPVRAAIDKIGGKWKPLILYSLLDGTKRYGELQKLIPEATQKMLTQQLRELERDGIITRKVFPTVPPRVEYSFASGGKSLRPAFEALCRWASSNSE